MKKRVISGIIGVIVLLLIVFTHPVVIGCAVFLLSLMGLYEFYSSVRKNGYKPISELGYFSCIVILLSFLLPFINRNLPNLNLFESFNKLFFKNRILNIKLLMLFLVYIIIIYMFSKLIFCNSKYKLQDIAVTLLGIIYIPFLFSFNLFIRSMDNGLALLWLVFIGAWITDVFAFFTGSLFGKHKLLPQVSPHKTVEGFLGGMVFCAIFIVLYGVFYLNGVLNININIIHYIVLGLILGFISQLGDWTASSIKRSVGIKDFGNIMPGHGGVLDRCDSLLFVAPAVYFYLNLLVL